MKRFFCILMTLALTATAAPVFAAQEYGTELEKAILKAKSVFSIPQECTEFSYYAQKAEGSEEKTEAWGLEWRSGDGKISVNAVIDSLGNVCSYRFYEEAEQAGLAGVDRVTAEKTASAFLKKAASGQAASMREVDQESNRAITAHHEFTYRYYVNDIPVLPLTATVRVNKYTGAVSAFDGFDAGFKMPSFPASEGGLSEDEAASAWLDELGLSLNYYSYYDYDKKNFFVYGAYSPKKPYRFAIDAKTGKPAVLAQENLRYMKSENATGDAAADSGGLSGAELLEVERAADLISQSEAEQKLQTAFPVLKKMGKVTESTLEKVDFDGIHYRWHIYFGLGYGAVDAETGEILSFNYYSGEKEKKTVLTEARAQLIAEELLRTLAPERFAQTKLYPYEPASGITRDGEGYRDYDFHYVRLVNGHPFMNNELTVTVDGVSGEIKAYRCSWYETVKFPALDKAMGVENAFEALEKIKGFDLVYNRLEDGSYGLVYQFKSSTDGIRMEPVNGQLLNYAGKVTAEKKLPVYTDMEKHWSKNYVQKLLENGYYLSGTEFKPNQTILQKEFFQYLFTEYGLENDTERLYEVLRERGIVLDSEKAPDQALTRQEAAKFMVRYLGLGRAGERPELFVNLFADHIEDGYKGYATLCKGLGIMAGDRNGRFNGTAAMSRAEAAAAVYNLVSIH